MALNTHQQQSTMEEPIKQRRSSSVSGRRRSSSVSGRRSDSATSGKSRPKSTSPKRDSTSPKRESTNSKRESATKKNGIKRTNSNSKRKSTRTSARSSAPLDNSGHSKESTATASSTCHCESDVESPLNSPRQQQEVLKQQQELLFCPTTPKPKTKPKRTKPRKITSSATADNLRSKQRRNNKRTSSTSPKRSSSSQELSSFLPPELKRKVTADSMEPATGHPPLDYGHGKTVTFGGAQGKIFWDHEKYETSACWYHKQDLNTLLDHEMKIVLRCSASCQKGLHVCLRGLEHVAIKFNKAEYVKRHVDRVLSYQKELRQQEADAEFSMQELCQKSRSLTEDDRKRAYMLGRHDERELRDVDLKAVVEEVAAEHRESCSKSKKLMEKSVKVSRTGIEAASLGLRLATPGTNPRQRLNPKAAVERTAKIVGAIAKFKAVTRSTSSRKLQL